MGNKLMGNKLMGNKLSEKKRKSWSKYCKKAPLSFYETSNDYWIFGKQHIKAIEESLNLLGFGTFLAQIILEYVRTADVQWNHPNYSTFIHTEGTPLDKDGKIKRIKNSGSARYKIIILGKWGVGKSSITMRIVANEFQLDNDPSIEATYSAQIGVNVSAKEYDNWNAKGSYDDVTLSIVDTGCQIRFVIPCDVRFRISDVKDAHIRLLVFSVIDQESFEHVKALKNNTEDAIAGERIKDCVMMVVANKCDLRDIDNSKYDFVNMEEVYEWCKENNISLVETSAKYGKNINLLFRHCVYEYEFRHNGN